MLRELTPQEQAWYDELNSAWLAFHKACFRRDGCVVLFIVGLVLSHWAVVPAGCVMALGLIWGRNAIRAVSDHRATVAILEWRVQQIQRACEVSKLDHAEKR